MTDQPGATPPPQPAAPANLPPIVQRAQNILLNPTTEWQVIKGEITTIPALFTGYAMIIGAIPALGVLIEALIHGRIVSGLIMAIFVYVLSLGVTYGLGVLIDVFGPNFGAAKDPVQSMKVAVYGMTASWIAGIAQAVPFVGGLIAALVSLYSLYLLFLGIQTVKDTPQDKAIIYTLVVVLVIGVVAGIVFAIFSSIFMAMIFGAFAFRH